MTNDLTSLKKVLLPMIRKIMPNLIAQEIVGVQPMRPMMTNEISTGEDQINGNMIYWVLPGRHAFAIVGAYGHPKETPAYNWCFETFGEANDDLTNEHDWTYTFGKYCFRSAESRTMFILRWGNENES